MHKIKRSNRKTAYTLVEVMVALTMFAFITLATSFALGVAIRSETATQAHNDSIAEVRSVMSVLTRDLRNAYASASNPYSLFTTNGTDANAILTFSSMAGRISAPTTAYNGTSATDGSDTTPQSDMSILTYSFDSSSHTLIRQMLTVPNADLFQTSTGAGQESILSSKVMSVQFQFYDMTNTQMRPDWNYNNQTVLASTTSGASGATGGTGAAAAPASTTDTTTGTITTNGVTTDAYLPQSVQITIVFMNAAGQPEEYVTTVSLSNYQPQVAGQKPYAAIVAGTTGGPGGPGGPGGTGGTGGTGGKGVLTPIDILPGLRESVKDQQ